MTRKSMIALAVLLALSGGTAVAAAQSQAARSGGAQAAAAQADAAQGGNPAGREAKPRLDANGDGFIDRTEAAAFPRIAARFDQLDVDKDGRLGPTEFKREPRHGAHGGANGEHRFAMAGKHRADIDRLDSDGDGRISRAEAAAQPRFAERFDQLDANQDGFVDRGDREARAKQRQDEWFAQADTDGNGQLSRAEYEAAHRQTHERMQERREKMQARRPDAGGKR